MMDFAIGFQEIHESGAILLLLDFTVLGYRGRAPELLRNVSINVRLDNP